MSKTKTTESHVAENSKELQERLADILEKTGLTVVSVGGAFNVQYTTLRGYVHQTSNIHKERAGLVLYIITELEKLLESGQLPIPDGVSKNSYVAYLKRIINN